MESVTCNTCPEFVTLAHAQFETQGIRQNDEPLPSGITKTRVLLTNGDNGDWQGNHC